jgi:hypothetical protein
MLKKSFLSRALTLTIIAMMIAGQISAQTKNTQGSSLRITVTDPNGALIASATVELLYSGGKKQEAKTNEKGEAYFPLLEKQKCRVRITAPGFDSVDLGEVAFKTGLTQIEVSMEIAGIKDELTVTQGEREKLVDPGGTAFMTILTPEQIAGLPDDPDELEKAIRDMAGPGALLRINGFTGGKLPPKSQIREIRFRLNPYTAENHASGLIGVDIFTKPGGDKWHGTATFGFRNNSLAARNAFSPILGPEQHRRIGLSLDGPLWKDHTSLSLSIQGSDSFDSKTIVAALPDGDFSDLARRPSRTLDLSARVEHALTKSHTLRGEYQRNAIRQDNLGVGDFDLPERAYTTDLAENILRISDTGLLTNRFVNEVRFQAIWQHFTSDPVSNSPAIQVLNAFNDGGAQFQSNRRVNQFEFVDNLDFVIGKNSLKAGVMVEAATYRTDEIRNPTGIFIFPNLEAFRASRPTTFFQRSGNPRVEFEQYQFGWFLQDEIRLYKNFTLSLGLRHEVQTNLRDKNNFAPRVAIAWAPFDNTVVRAGTGIFYNWFAADIFENVLRVDGVQQVDTVVRNPGFPDPFVGGAPLLLPPSVIQMDPAMRMPYVQQSSFGIERQMPKFANFRATYVYQRGVHQLRGHNINAPSFGVGRPDPDLGNIVQVEATALSSLQLLNFSLNAPQTDSRFYWLVFYSLSKNTDETDGPLGLPANNFDLRAERGPSLLDSRHRFFGIINWTIFKELRLGNLFRYNSARPYNITTGFDDNGDTVSNDRPEGFGRNSERGASEWDISSRLSWSFGFGKPPESATPRVTARARVIRPRGDVEMLGSITPESTGTLYRVQLYFQAYNILNHANRTNFSGVQTSPFFGQATAALPGRRFEIGARFSF